jgi:hypothetical protein
MPIAVRGGERLRRKKRSGISGSATTASMAMKIANSDRRREQQQQGARRGPADSFPPTIA